MRLFWLSCRCCSSLAGCGDRPAEPAGTAHRTRCLARRSVDGGDHGGQGPHAGRGHRGLVEFTDDGRLIARAGCNMMQARWTRRRQAVVNGGLAIDRVGCDPARHDQDGFVAKVLGASPSWQLEADMLTITSDATLTGPTARSRTGPPARGTEWTLDTLVDGDVASSSSGHDRATLVSRRQPRSRPRDRLQRARRRVHVDGDQITFDPRRDDADGVRA